VLVDFKLNFAGDTEFTVIPKFSGGICIPFWVKDIYLSGMFRIEMNFGYEATTFAIAAIEQPLIDFSVFPMQSSLNISLIPGFSEWLHGLVDKFISRNLIWPNKMLLFNALNSQFKKLETTLNQIGKSATNLDSSIEIPQKEQVKELEAEVITNKDSDKDGFIFLVETELAPQITSSPANLNTKEEVLKLFGIVPTVLEYAETLCDNRDLFVNFPIERNEVPAFSSLPLRKQLHAKFMLEHLPALASLRYDVCPQNLDENTFWYIYFSLIRNKTRNIFDDNDNEKAKRDWTRLQKIIEKDRRSTLGDKLHQLSILNI